MKIDAIILAAGKGTRMNSALPKVLNNLAGKPLLQHLLDTTKELSNCKHHLVVGNQQALVKSSVKTSKNSIWVSQSKQLGTGHAVKQTLKNLRPNSTALILYGDVPLITSRTMKSLINADLSF